MSSGRPSGIVAITPPDQYPEAVWEELARQGKLGGPGTGWYELPYPPLQHGFHPTQHPRSVPHPTLPNTPRCRPRSPPPLPAP